MFTLPPRRRAALPAAALALAVLTGCGGPAPAASGPAAGFPLTVSSCGREVTFPAPPRRVVTVGSIAAPMLAAAGAADRVVTRTFETAPFPGQYGPALQHAEVVASTGELAREEIINRNPDLVVSFEGAAVTPDDLAAVRIPLLVTRGYCKDAAGSFDDVFADIELYGRLFGTEAAATASVHELRARVDAVARRHPAGAATTPAAALIISRDGAKISAYGSTSTVATQMRILGLDNIFGDVAKRNFDAATETLVQRDPAVIVLLTQGSQTPESATAALRARPELASLRAIRDNRIVAVPFGYTGPGPVAVEGLEVLDRALGTGR
ncbi:ABC transporter substrate-binding protein [Nocardia thailandica]|uniref:ABC transporter substrate-binding protein n=1 Tax=Nocardia thailandica TaxID=257275 RepID=UPI0003078676|nr:ABC transporter substrate-binding protein [Nocardia thailandica]